MNLLARKMGCCKKYFMVESLGVLFIRAEAGAGVEVGAGEKNTRSRSNTDRLRNSHQDN